MYFAHIPPDEPLDETQCCGFNVFNVYFVAVQIEIQYVYIFIFFTKSHDPNIVSGAK